MSQKSPQKNEKSEENWTKNDLQVLDLPKDNANPYEIYIPRNKKSSGPSIFSTALRN